MSETKFKGKDNLIAVKVPKELKEKVKQAAKAKGLNVSNFTRLLFIDYIEKQQAKGKR